MNDGDWKNVEVREGRLEFVGELNMNDSQSTNARGTAITLDGEGTHGYAGHVEGYME